jgi:hypothetical protein
MSFHSQPYFLPSHSPLPAFLLILCHPYPLSYSIRAFLCITIPSLTLPILCLFPVLPLCPFYSLFSTVNSILFLPASPFSISSSSSAFPLRLYHSYHSALEGFGVYSMKKQQKDLAAGQRLLKPLLYDYSL